MTPTFLGDDEPVPVPVDGAGGLVLDFWFDSTVRVVLDGRVVHDHPNYDVWISAPVLAVDGTPAAASWSRWWYPLPEGTHEIEVTEPVPARATVQVAAAAGASLGVPGRPAYRAGARRYRPGDGRYRHVAPGSAAVPGVRSLSRPRAGSPRRCGSRPRRWWTSCSR